jgi:signal peptidase I
MKRPFLITLAIVCLLVVAGVILFVTHALEFYTVSTTSNQPNYQPGDLMMASNFKKPGNKDLIVFKRGSTLWIFRCIGKEGDVVEIKNATVYLNGKLLAEPYTMKEYYIPTKEILAMDKFIIKNNISSREISYGSSLIALSDAQFKELNKPLKQFSKPKGGTPAEDFFPNFRDKGYNEDNLGPITVPQGFYFVLGDNRHDAFDSRFFGFVKAKDVISTVIN